MSILYFIYQNLLILEIMKEFISPFSQINEFYLIRIRRKV